MLALSKRAADAQGSYRITVDELLSSERFCHLNTLIVSRQLFADLGGFDESIRWEEDRDLFWRLLDRANGLIYSPLFVSRHNVPDKTAAANASTILSELERRVQQLRVFDKACLFASHPAIREAMKPPA